MIGSSTREICSRPRSSPRRTRDDHVLGALAQARKRVDKRRKGNEEEKERERETDRQVDREQASAKWLGETKRNEEETHAEQPRNRDTVN